MAIGFVRLEFVQRSAGKTACGKSAYMAREKIHFEGHKFAEAQIFDWSYKERPAYHEVLLPSHVDQKFKSLETLWNAVEKKEIRHNSQVAMEMVFALPDDQMISLDDKIEMIKAFIEEHFIKNGLAAQIDIHRPDKKIQLSTETGEIKNLDHNWHAHVLIPTRRFKECGLELADHKARDLMPVIRGNKVISGLNWGKLWAQHQNQFFEDKGLDLRVDETGIISQKHLGPLRMRGRAFALEEENQMQCLLNQIESKDPTKILTKITETKSVFNFQDVERFLQKHVDPGFVDQVREEFWKQDNIVQMLDSKTKEALNKFSTPEILEEEKQILRLADRIHQSLAFKLNVKDLATHKSNLNQEQKQAFDKIIQGHKLTCIEGHAGAGKSYLLSCLKTAYEQEGYTVRAFGPDNATAAVLQEKGFSASENIYRFLFSLHHGKREISKGKEIWILDESSKIGNRPLLEFLKAAEKHQVQLVFAGCSSQLPSVERGGFFKIFCKRYGAEELIEIQRQKKQEQREMAKNLAHGKMSVAVDQLAKLHGLKWSETKEESIEKLIKAWAVDQTIFPTNSSLILAHTNAEVRILNEMARLYRQEKGELHEEEYICKALDGKKLIVSVGDKIEFRKNDLELGIKNGMRGTLIEAQPEQFVVALQGEARKIIFNPQTYTGFQLGYATTYTRSQGQTLDRVYVLHSPYMNKEKFYVTLTRHAHRVNLYVSRRDASCLMDLKRQAFRKNLRENTLQYTHQKEIEQQKTILERTQSIAQLKESSSVLEKMKGYTLEGWEAIKGKVKGYQQDSRDLRPSQGFFNPVLKETATEGQVIKLKDQYLDVDQRENIQKTFTKILRKIESVPSQPSHFKGSGKPNWNHLSEENKVALNKYYQTLNQASILHTIVLSETKNQDVRASPHFQEWQCACATRNAQAHEVLKSAPSSFIQEAIGKCAFQMLEKQALKHEGILQRQNSQSDLVEQAKERIESLLYRLFPDGPTDRNSKGVRFGSKGSLSVICSGENKGLFYDFKKKEGGGPIQLVQHVLNLNYPEAKEWIRDFLGQPKETYTPLISRSNLTVKTNQEWSSLKPSSAQPAPSLKELSKVLSQKYQEVARHAYLDEKGDLLFYVLRLVDKEDPTKKNIRPLSYGQWQGAQSPSWSLKNYQVEKRPLYHLDQLAQNPLAKVLIVEGEKTADAAQKLFSDQNIICVTWQGGASAVLKSDWIPLHGREVLIWPDNDEVGFKAADEIIDCLRKTGVKSLSLIDKGQLTKDFPKKWDLADPLPQEKSIRHLGDMMLMAKEKSVGIDQLLVHFKEPYREHASERLHAQEILWRVEDRLWSKLEEKYGGRVWEIKQEILDETKRLLLNQQNLEKKLQVEYQVSSELASRMARQLVLQQSETGKQTTAIQIDELKQRMASISTNQFDNLNGRKNNEFSSYAAEKTLTQAFTFGMAPDLRNMKGEISAMTQNLMREIKIQEELKMAQNEQIKQKSQNLDYSL